MSQESPFGRRCNRRANYLRKRPVSILAEVNAVAVRQIHIGGDGTSWVESGT